jgi:uncharacterized delta-60 repeat protein
VRTRIVAGRALEPLERRALFSASVTPDGTFDPPDRDGEIFDHVHAHGDVEGQRAAVQADGKIVIASPTFQLDNDGHLGHDALVGTSDFRIRRIVGEPPDDATVPLDTAFGDAGSVTVDFFGQDDVPGAIAVQPDGKIVVAGRAKRAGSDQVVMALVRLNADGAVDDGFGDHGKVVAEFGAAADAHAIAIDAQARIVVAGIGAGETAAAGQDFAVARFNADGSPDATFGGDGKVAVPLGGTDSAGDVVIQPDGKILLAGASAGTGGTAVGERGDLAAAGALRGFALARLNPDGSPDAGFGSGGTVITEFPGRAIGVAVRDDGSIVVGGDRLFTNPATGALVDTGAAAKYHADGSLDTSFGGGDGVAFDPRSDHQLDVRAAVVDPAGGVLLVGQHYIAGGVGTSDYGVVRFTPDGVLDTTVGTAGLLTTDLGHTWDAPQDAILVRGGTRLQAIGASGWGYTFSTVRYALDIGVPDPAPQPNPPPQPEPAPGPNPPPSPTPQPTPPPTPLPPPRPRPHPLPPPHPKPGPPKDPGDPGDPDPPDIIGPQFAGKSVVKRGRFYQFKVKFAAAGSSSRTPGTGAVDPTTTQVIVSGPNGFEATADRVKLKTGRRGSSVAVYRMSAPGGTFDAGDNGTYTVQLRDTAAPAATVTPVVTDPMVLTPTTPAAQEPTTLRTFFVACPAGKNATGVLKE